MLTIMIPTMNRSDFLIRLLNYYADTGYKHWISIGDSSNSEHVEKTKNAIKNIGGRLKVIYNEFPGLNDAECMQQIIKSVSTPYVVFCADDDFLVSDGLEQCIGFLESNHDYNSAHGIASIFTIQSSGPYGKFVNNYNYRLPSIEAETASQRLLDHLSNYSVTLFCVHRMESWQDMYKDITPKHFAAEMLPCCLSVIHGKVKQLNFYYLARQNHDRRVDLPEIHKWVKNPDGKKAYELFSTRLAEALALKDEISFDKAKNIVEQAFKSYLDGLTKSMTYARMGKVARYMPGMNRVITKLKQKRYGNLSLSALLNPSSPYHKDFMTVYHAVTIPPV